MKILYCWYTELTKLNRLYAQWEHAYVQLTLCMCTYKKKKNV